MRNTLRTAALGAALALAAGTASAAPASSLTFDPAKYTVKTATVNGETVTYRAYEGIVYVQNPVEPQYQTLNFYVPTAYYEGKSIHGYTADTAPVFFANSVGGYMPGPAGQPGLSFEGKINAGLVALSRGLVVAYPGARGRTLKNSAGQYDGKAPAAIVDLKAAVRYLKYNDKVMPGNANRIVSDGTSAGGALSALLGASGNAADYEPYLKALGAAPATDDIWAAMAYCPITNLENADAAYEWLLGTLKETKAQGGGGMMPPGGGQPPAGDQAPAGGQTAANPFGAPSSAAGPLTADQIALSAQLKALFPAYVNSLGLKAADGSALTLNADGTGPFAQYIQSLIVASAQKALDAGQDLSTFAWVKVSGKKVTGVDWAGYLAASGRKKAVPSFDELGATSGENNLFGTATVDNRHFTAFGQAHDTGKATSAEAAVVKMMNPMAYLGTKAAATAPFWRIRHGSVDSDTANAIPAILATKLANSGYSVDFALPWNTPHSGDYDLDDLFNWVDSIAKK